MRSSSLRLAIAIVAVVLFAAGGAVAAVVSREGSTSLVQRQPKPPPPAADAQVINVDHGMVPWDRPLQIVVANGRLTSVRVLDDRGREMSGRVTGGGAGWTSSTVLVPLSHYTADVQYVDLVGHGHQQHFAVTARDTDQRLIPTLSPGDGDVVGVGMPVIVYFNHPVPVDRRTAVERGLQVTTSPAVQGAWHWMNSAEVHWRPPTYWSPGTHVSVRTDLGRVWVDGTLWGDRRIHTVSYRIGDAHISKVDVAAHVMNVYVNGKRVRSMPISAGRDKYPTMGGVHIALEKAQMVVMDSATVGIPRNSPDGYYEKVYWNVRISYSGEFVHAAPWSVAEQGSSNVSHGCVNLSPSNAQWFYGFARRGDFVDVINTPRPPDLNDPGTADWNMSWSRWAAGSATS